MIRVAKSPLPVVALTHPGMKGKNNEDRYGVSAYKVSNNSNRLVLLAILSDGIGGHRAGEVASEMAVEIISQYAAESDGRNPPSILQEAIQEASQRIREQAVGNPEQQGMGATCACAWVSENRLFTATVGDSRIYLMRGSQIIQLSIDHTWIQEALERGLLQPEEVNGHPNAHVIRRYLGSPALPEVDFRLRLKEGETDAQSLANQGLKLLPGDRVLLCSDGLTDLVKQEEILGACLGMSQEEAGQYLINLANQRGGHDNITLISIEVPSARPAAAVIPPVAGRKRATLARSLAIGCLGVVLLGVIVGGFMSGWFLSLLPPLQTATPTFTATVASQATLPPPVPAKLSPTPTATRRVASPSPTVTPWIVGTPTAPLPVVTVKP